MPRRALCLVVLWTLGACSAVVPDALDANTTPDARDGEAALPEPDAPAPPDGSPDALRPADATATPDAPAPHPDAAPDAPAPPAITSCGHWAGNAAWSCQSDGHTMRRTVGGGAETHDCPLGCFSMPFGFDDLCRVRAGAVANTVNAHTLTGTQAAWIHYTAACVVPRLEGTRDARLTAAARVAWWSLKEGLLDLSSNPNAVGFSLCTTPSGDMRIGALATCGAGAAWQVGASAIQVPCCTLASVEATATRLFSGQSPEQVLAYAATEAGYAGTATGAGVTGSTGSLRQSWLLRASPVGFTFQAPIVTSECVTGSRGWCYSTAWSTSASYAPDRASALRAITDVQAILGALAP